MVQHKPNTKPSLPFMETTRQPHFSCHVGVSFWKHFPLITSVGSATEAWTCLERTYASKSHTRIMGLCEILDNTTTKNMSIAEYLQTVKSISETLALVGSSMSDAELIHTVLKGLGPEFKSLNPAIRAWYSLISFEELHDKLADYEITSKHVNPIPVKQSITAQFNQQTNSKNKGHNPSFNNNNNNMSHFVLDQDFHVREIPTIGLLNQLAMDSNPDSHIPATKYGDHIIIILSLVQYGNYVTNLVTVPRRAGLFPQISLLLKRIIHKPIIASVLTNHGLLNLSPPTTLLVISKIFLYTLNMVVMMILLLAMVIHFLFRILVPLHLLIPFHFSIKQCFVCPTYQPQPLVCISLLQL